MFEGNKFNEVEIDNLKHVVYYMFNEVDLPNV